MKTRLAFQICSRIAVAFSVVATLATSAQAIEGATVRPSYTYLGSQRYYGFGLGVGVDQKLTDAFRLGAGGRYLSRTYSGGVRIEDSAFDLAGSYSFGSKYYVEAQGSYTPDADILPSWNAVVTPHLVFGDTDVGLGMAFNHYQKVDAGQLNPLIIHALTDNFSLVFGGFFVRTDSWIAAFQTQAVYNFAAVQSLRFGGASGTSLEDAGVVAQFKSVSAEYGYRFDRWAIFLSFGRYWSDLRTEDSVGLRWEVR